MLHLRDGIVLVMGGVVFLPNIAFGLYAKKFNFGSIKTTKLYSSLLQDPQGVSLQTSNGLPDGPFSEIAFFWLPSHTSQMCAISLILLYDAHVASVGHKTPFQGCYWIPHSLSHQICAPSVI